MNIRIANIKDIEKILLLENQMFELHLKEQPNWFKNTLNYNKNYDIIKNITGNNNEEIFIAEDNNIELSTWEFNKDVKEFYEHLGMKTKMVKMEIRAE